MADAARNILVFIAVCVILVGYAGNLLMITSILAFNHLRTRSNALLLSLAVADLLFLVTVAPFFLVSYISDSWPYHHGYCVITANLSFILTGVSLCHLTAISMFRFFSVVCPTKELLRNRSSVCFMIVISWLLPVVIPLVTMVGRSVSAGYSSLYSRCVLTKTDNPTVFNFMVMSGSGIPFICTIFAYIGIYVAVKKSRQRIQRHSGPSVQARHPANSNSDRYVEIRLAKQSAVIFLSFLVCFGPYVLLNFIDSDGSCPKEAYMICSTLFWLSSSINPVLYGLMSRSIRQAYRRIATPCKTSTVETAETVRLPTYAAPI